MSDSHGTTPIVGSSSAVGSLPILGPSPITLGSPSILSPQSPPILGPSPSILCGPSTVGSPTIVGSPSIIEVDRHPGLLDRMSNIGPSNTPNDEKCSTTNDEKYPKNNRKEKHSSAVIWVFSWSEIVDYVLQIAGITAGIVFGVWVIKTYSATETSLGIAASANNLSTNALAQSKLANQLALLSFCTPHLEAIPPSEFTIPCATVSKSVFNTVLYGHTGGPQGVMPPAIGSQLNPNTTNPLGGGGAAESGPYVAPHSSVAVDPQPTPSNSSQHGNQTSADSSSSSSNSQALGPKTTSPHQKTTVRFAVLVGIIAAVVAFLVIVGALLAGRKRLKIRVRITTDYEC